MNRMTSTFLLVFSLMLILPAWAAKPITIIDHYRSIPVMMEEQKKAREAGLT